MKMKTFAVILLLLLLPHAASSLAPSSSLASLVVINGCNCRRHPRRLHRKCFHINNKTWINTRPLMASFPSISSTTTTTALNVKSLRDIMDDKLNFKRGKRKTENSDSDGEEDGGGNTTDEGPAAAAMDAFYDSNIIGNNVKQEKQKSKQTQSTTASTTIIQSPPPQMQMQQPQQPDMMTMNVSEIKRELRLYGIPTTNTKLLRRDWESLLSRERKLRGGAGKSYGGTKGRKNDVMVVPGVGNVLVSSMTAESPMTMAEENEDDEIAFNLTSNNKEELQEGEKDESQKVLQYYDKNDDNNEYVDSTTTTADTILTSSSPSSSSSGSKSSTKLREMQIAYEFERVQSQYPLSDDNDDASGGSTAAASVGAAGRNVMSLRTELETRFQISTRYFLGTKEMAYALAVARVDDAIERQRMGMSPINNDDEECRIADYYSNSDNDTDMMSSMCLDDGVLPTPEELIEMEYDNLLQHPSWFDDENDALSSELESQYGIPAKHFMGKKEMAYALAVERVDRAMKEGGGYILDDDDDINVDMNGGTLTNEDMMRMMEEEMWHEDEIEDEDVELQRLREEVEEIQRVQIISISHIGEEEETASLAYMKTFKKEEPNPFHQTKTISSVVSSSSSTISTTPLADMIKTNDRRKRPTQPKRTPLSLEPPRSFGREQQQQQLRQQQQYGFDSEQQIIGTVIGPPDPTYVTTATPIMGGSQSKLKDILKGSEEQRRYQQQQQQQVRLRTTTTTSTTMPPPFQPRRPKFTTMSSQYDNSFASNDGHSDSINNNYYNMGNIPWDFDNPMNGDGGTVPFGFDVPPPLHTDFRMGGYTSSWDRDPNVASSRSYSSATASATTTTTYRVKRAAPQRPFEPTPFAEPGSHSNSANASGSAKTSSRTTRSSSSGGVGGPKRVPPQTPFTSPVTDGARYTSSSNSHTARQDTFTPFTVPGKRSTNGIPPPSRKSPSSDTRKFNIKDTPDTTQPFIGVGGWADMGSSWGQQTTYSPPLHVEPPPRDPKYDDGMKDNPYYFEPAPFSRPQPHAVHTGTYARPPPRDKWNRVQQSNSPPPPPHASNANTRQSRQKRQEGSKKGQRVVSTSSSTSPFDNLKDMFSNIGNKKKNVKKDEPKGFTSGNVEVFSTNNNIGGRYQQDGIHQKIVEVEIITTKERKVHSDDEKDHQFQSIPTSAEVFENAWKGGSESFASTSTGNKRRRQQRGGDTRTFTTGTTTTNTTTSAVINDDTIQQRARELLSTNSKIQEIVIRAQSNDKLQNALLDCVVYPKLIGRYIDDPDVGPILNELKNCIIQNG